MPVTSARSGRPGGGWRREGQPAPEAPAALGGGRVARSSAAKAAGGVGAERLRRRRSAPPDLVGEEGDEEAARAAEIRRTVAGCARAWLAAAAERMVATPRWRGWARAAGDERAQASDGEDGAAREDQRRRSDALRRLGSGCGGARGDRGCGARGAARAGARGARRGALAAAGGPARGRVGGARAPGARPSSAATSSRWASRRRAFSIRCSARSRSGPRSSSKRRAVEADPVGVVGRVGRVAQELAVLARRSAARSRRVQRSPPRCLVSLGAGDQLLGGAVALRRGAESGVERRAGFGAVLRARRVGAAGAVHPLRRSGRCPRAPTASFGPPHRRPGALVGGDRLPRLAQTHLGEGPGRVAERAAGGAAGRLGGEAGRARGRGSRPPRRPWPRPLQGCGRRGGRGRSRRGRRRRGRRGARARRPRSSRSARARFRKTAQEKAAESRKPVADPPEPSTEPRMTMPSRTIERKAA